MTDSITVLENFSGASLATAVSRSQDPTAYLMGLYAAIWQHGSPDALAQCSESYEPDHRHLKEVLPRQVFET